MDSELFRRNLASLAGALPGELLDALPALHPQAVLRQEPDGRVNIDAGGRLLYPVEGAAVHAAQQLKDYLAAPARHYSQLGAVSPDAPYVADALMRDVLTRCQGLSLNSLPDADGGYLVSFGLGLGLHLPGLVDALDVRELVVMEQSVEMLFHCLHVLDWAPIVARMEARGGGVRLILSPSAKGAANELMHHLRGRHFSLIDGSYLFQHYQTRGTAEMIQGFRDLLPVISGRKGFVEDELLMLRNASANLLRYDHRVLEGGTTAADPGMPAVIVGSGPSVDGAIEQLKALEEHAVFFSGGTGTSVMRKHGLKPHFHTEIENVPDIFDGIRQAADLYDLAGITLLATNTVDPRIPELFDSRIFVNRDTVSSSRLYHEGRAPLDSASPTVTNLAARAAIAMGFRTLYLFGIDLGSKQQDQHHSGSSIYADSKDPFWQTGGGIEPFLFPVEGNFGGTVYTNGPFLLTRSLFQDLFAAYPDCQVFNCSDGALIEGTQPLPLGELNPSGLPESGEGALAQLLAGLVPAAAGAAEIPQLLDQFEACANSWFGHADRALAENADDFLSLHDACLPLINGPDGAVELGAGPALRWTCLGTLTTMLQFGHFLLRRVDESERGPVFASFRECMQEQIKQMRRQVNETLSTLRKQVDGLS